MGANPFAGHLWFISALIGSYLLYGLFIKLSVLTNTKMVKDISMEGSTPSANGGGKGCNRYKIIYIVGLCSMLFNILISIKSYAIAGETSNNTYLVYRNTLFYGFPMFTMGLYIGENGPALKQGFSLTCKKVTLISSFFTILGFIQVYGIGPTEVPIAMVLEVFLWLVFFCDNPIGEIIHSKSSIRRIFSDVSMFVYFMHIFIDNIIKVSIDINVFGNLYPVLVVAICVVLGLVFSVVKSWIFTIYGKAKGVSS